MRLKRFITEEEQTKLLELSKNKNFIKNEAYSKINKEDLTKIEIEDYNYIKDVLRDVIDGFSEFSAFTDKNIRLQYNYNYDGIGKTSFYGVGYITLKELKEGF